MNRRKRFWQTVNVPIDPQTRHKIEKMADDRNLAMADIVREILSNALRDPPEAMQ